ncbi:hypothetical protein HanRHA438_Chr04g0180861 [Helianthus annuus]|nr:hypothetical protein HanRHA438_Chr04g0180861 [Helianthus annuus]
MTFCHLVHIIFGIYECCFFIDIPMDIYGQHHDILIEKNVSYHLRKNPIHNNHFYSQKLKHQQNTTPFIYIFSL